MIKKEQSSNLSPRKTWGFIAVALISFMANLEAVNANHLSSEAHHSRY
jgi:hypothetical protein